MNEYLFNDEELKEMERRVQEKTLETVLHNLVPLIKGRFPAYVQNQESETALVLLDLRNDDQRALYDTVAETYRSKRNG